MITSKTNQLYKQWLKLKQKKYRDQTHLYLVEGYHMVEEAIKHDVIQTIISTKEYDSNYPVEIISESLMRNLAFTKTPQQIMAVCIKKDYSFVEGTRYLLLDRIQDPGNIGTMIRTAVSFDYDCIIMSNDSVDIYNDKVLRSTQGAIYQIPIIKMDLLEAIDILHKHDVYVMATALKNAESIDTHQTYLKLAIIMGNEGQGIEEEIIEKADKSIYIPISYESLNVAVAAGIMMYEFKE